MQRTMHLVTDPTEPRKPRLRRWGKWIAIGFGALLLISAITNAAKPAATTAASTPATTAPTTRPAQTPPPTVTFTGPGASVPTVEAAPPPVVATTPELPPTSDVVYEIESDAGTVSVTYTTLAGGQMAQAQDTNTSPPWTKNLQVARGDYNSYGVLGQMSAGGSTVTCRITVDGDVIAEQTSTGPYAIASCNGT